MAELYLNGRRYDDEFIGQVVLAAATILAENDRTEESSTSDAALRAVGQSVATLTKEIIHALGV